MGQLPYDFGGSYNYPAINANGDILFASIGGFFSSPAIYETTTSGPFPGNFVAYATMGRINDSGDIVTITGDLNSPGTIQILSGPGYTQTTYVGSGSWADINNNDDVIFEAPDSNGVRQIYLYTDKPDIAATSLSWDTTQGGVDYGYTISNANLPQPTTAALYWVPTATFDSTQDTLIPGSVFTTATAAQTDPYTGHIDAPTVGTPPPGTEDLLFVVDPTNLISPADTSKVASLALSSSDAPKTTPPNGVL